MPPTGVGERSEPSNRVDGRRLWLTAVVNRARAVVGRPFPAAVATFGAAPTAVVVLYAALRWRVLPVGFLFSLASVVVVLVAGPYLVWYYDDRLYPQFVVEFTDVVGDEERLERIASRYRRLLADRWAVAAGLACLPIPPLLYLGRGFLRTRGLYGVGDPLFWAVAAVLLWVGVLVGIGFLVVVVSLLTIRAVVAGDLRIDPLHPDGLGGVSVVGYLSIRTTALFSLGALLIPLQLQYAAVVGPYASALIYLMACLYAAAIAASFLYPTLLVYRRGDEVRSEILDDLREQYLDVKRAAAEPVVGADTETTDSAAELKLRRIRQEYEDYRTVSLYPFEPLIFVRLVGSVLLPLVFIVVDTLLRPETLGRLLSLVG